MTDEEVWTKLLLTLLARDGFTPAYAVAEADGLLLEYRRRFPEATRASPPPWEPPWDRPTPKGSGR